MNDPYQVLGISPSATDDEVKSAYRRLAKKYHPDHNNGSAEAEKMMMQVNDAYAQIMDMRKNGGRSSQSTSYGGYGQSYGGSPYGNPYGAYQGYGQAYGYSQGGAPQFSTVREYLSYGRYMEALHMLNAMQDRSAEWYYLCARAREGLGDDIAALNYARQAANMDPGNYEYQAYVQELTSGGSAYRQQGVNYGGIQNCLCSNPCLTCALLNLCCGGTGMRFCFFPCC